MKTRNSKQQGITLVIALIMLTVLTTIAITVANMATVDLKVVANQQASQQARAAAESGIDYLINNPSKLDTLAPFSPTDPSDPKESNTFNLPVPSGQDWAATVEVKRMGDPLPCPRASLPMNIDNIDSTTIAKCVYFEMISTGTSTKGASSVLTRGFYRKVGGFVSG